ncbi:MAG: helix-turn-helix transcriptional regulator [Clostridia bacterium]|nr:helix-turn-helix transcriptional regulator [Clostridia bacterium]
MRLSDAMKKRVLQLCDERNITINKMCTICGITQSTLGSFYNAENSVLKVRVIYNICNGLGITLKDFFDTDLFIDLDEED